MFTFFQCYMPETWEAQEKAGLINKNSGIRFLQSIDVPADKKFNVLARKGGTLYEIIKERQLPFYIDRLQGGDFFEGYDYDMDLVDEYRRLLGDKFFGFQMHEWMSNVISDIKKLTDNGCPEPWTVENIKETIFKAFPYQHLFLEAMNAEEMAAMGHIVRLDDYLEEMRSLFARRMAYTGDMLLPCDSAYQAPELEFKAGVKRVMPEVGAQTRDSRIQIAYARGSAKGFGRSFGVYYEPWGGSPFSSCCYHREGKNEWNIGNENFPFKTAGDNGGSSRSLQNRIFLYAYFAGASFLSEEWGMCNTFYDWNDFELTPYGKIKLDFIRFTEKYPDIGDIITPAAVVLPEDMTVLDNFDENTENYLSFPVTGDRAAHLKEIRKTLREIFVDSGKMLGTETVNMRNYTVADAVDIVNENCFRPEEYKYLIDLTGDAAFARAHSNIVKSGELKELLKKELPCEVDGDIHTMVSRRADGTCFLMMLNNSGVERTVEKGEILLREADTTVTVSIRSGAELKMLEGSAMLEADGGKYHVTIPAGGWFFGAF